MLDAIEKAATEAESAAKVAKEKRKVLDNCREKFWKLVGKPPGSMTGEGLSLKNLLGGSELQSGVKGTLFFGACVAAGAALLYWATPIMIALGIGFLCWKAWSER